MLSAAHTQVEPIAVVVRPAAPSELRWVCATWARAMRVSTYESAMVTTGLDRRKVVRIGLRGDGVEIDASMLSRAMHSLVDSLLAESTVLVATLPDMPEEPCGWVAFNGPILHFAFVAPIARHAGVARQLVSPLGCSSASHMTALGVVLTRYLRGVVE